MFDFETTSQTLKGTVIDGAPPFTPINGMTWECDFFHLEKQGTFAKLATHFDGDGRLIGVELFDFADGLTATEIARFPWARWISAASHVAKAAKEGHVTLDATRGTIEELRDEARQRRRPGRAGHGEDFYRSFADRYTRLVSAGVKNPIRVITEELKGAGEHCSPHTVSTWAKRARELGYLPKPGKGRTR